MPEEKLLEEVDGVSYNLKSKAEHNDKITGAAATRAAPPFRAPSESNDTSRAETSSTLCCDDVSLLSRSTLDFSNVVRLF